MSGRISALDRGVEWDTIDGCGHPAHDERVMVDGRPAFAWHYEMERLREENALLKDADEYQANKRLADVLGIVKWVFIQRPEDLSTHLHVRFHDIDRIRALDWREVMARAEIIPEPAAVAPQQEGTGE